MDFAHAALKHVPGYSSMSLVFRNLMYMLGQISREKNNNMTRGSHRFVVQSSPNLAHV